MRLNLTDDIIDVERAAPWPSEKTDGDPTVVVRAFPMQRSRHDRPTAKIVALVPAYNESATIAGTIRALRRQWSPPIDRIVVVPNNCTDDTAEVAAAGGAEVYEFPGHNPHKKAGALNWAVLNLLPGLADDDFLLVTDADSLLHPDFTQHAVRALTRPRVGHRWRRPVGAACASFHTSRDGTTLLDRLQRNEYTRFARQVARRMDKALVLSGVATLLQVRVIRDVLIARGQGRLPGYRGELYHRDTATEDIELTFAIQALGYRPVAPSKATATTESMPTWQALKDQRLRWQRGMLDSLRLYGMNRRTFGTWVRQVAIYAGSLVAPVYLTFLALLLTMTGSLPFDPRWLPLTGLFLLERVWTVRSNRPGDIALAAALLPEWLFEQWRAGVYWLAVWKTVRGADREWINP
ncbi:glycosyltransferase family 2 protein [Dactylosporangium aurantiacum]|uniref:Glycosyltransferase family 2 protein n=1 Tax=Dactylosporangium aurantiacum TaxID=35754 RepID=A0A9Q9IFP7_9ACTN|nr:glycosyltransferase family 2 protein [Dactylosporangium aurantiacum]MDG6101092.1 glycosyltransferase family 2 protein [Dactylosporangium aurantiacum]UWZ54871.1 glycosyltransferase family 2 protein [Dactylosporangium aurantiacum]